MAPREHVPSSGKHSERQVPSKVQRRSLARPPHKLRLCQDNRNYVSVPFTIQGPITIADYGPMWRVDRDYWVARVTVNIGKHDDALHPNDGTPSGRTAVFNLRRVRRDVSDVFTDDPVLTSDNRLVIHENHHEDAVNDEQEGAFIEGDFAIQRLQEGDHLYPRVLHIGTGRPGTAAVVTAVLIPIP